MTRTKRSHWYNFPYILGLLPIVILVAAVVIPIILGGAMPMMRGMVRHEVVRSLSVAYASPTTNFPLPVPGDSTRGGIVIGTIQSEEDRRNVQVHGVFSDCQENCLEVSPSDERIKRQPAAMPQLNPNDTAYEPELKRLAWSAEHDDARCYVKAINSDTAPFTPRKSYTACLSLSTGAYVYTLWHL